MSDAPLSQLDAQRITTTVDVLEQRINERFPNAHLVSVCDHLGKIARQTQARSEAIGRPIRSVRLLSFLVVGGVLATLVWLVVTSKVPNQTLTATELIPVLDAGFNAVLVIGGVLLFVTTFERRIKRSRCLAAIHELRSLAHIIDMHQLTKDPERLLRKGDGKNTKSSPQPTMTAFELNRYLDYCTEMLSLIGKIAALYVQDFSDEIAVDSVNKIEQLTTGLSRKIWQKLMILQPLMEMAREES